MKYYLIGEHLPYSFSPEIHRAFGQYDYACREISREELGPFLKARAFSGLNVTVPYKQAVIPYLDRLDPRAAAVGAVNTVVNRAGELCGYNTDFDGMAAALRSTGIDPKGKKVLILGTGGTSKTALAVCRTLGAAELRRVSRSGREGAWSYEQAYAEGRGAEILINTTPVGTCPDLDGLPVDPAAFPRLSGVMDCVYNPLRTRLVLEARSRGIPAAGGLEMLVRQAALSCELFTGKAVEEAELGRILKELRLARENLVLIGMPGAGKSSVGRLLAQKTGRELADLDEMIERRTGKSIRAIFSEHGEAAFRALEAETVSELSRSGGMILATGGGTVLDPENVRRLRQNGRLILLDRPPEELMPSEARPLGDTAEKLRRLYEERRPIYLAAADCGVSVVGSAEQTAAIILEMRETSC